MKEPATYADKLEQALGLQRNHLNQTVLPQVKGYFESFRGTFQNFYTVLLRKSLVREDPYKAEQKISEIEIPPSTEVGELDKVDQLGLRLSMFDNQLDFLLRFYQFSVDFLSLKRIRLLIGLTNFIRWEHLTTTSTHVNTRILAETVSKVRGGSDTFSIQVINNAQNQLAGFCNDINRALKGLNIFHRERYKLDVRKTVVDLLNLTPETVAGQRDSVMAEVKKRFAHSLPGMPYYEELIREIIDEDFGSDGRSRQAAVLKQLSIIEEKTVEKKQVDFRGLLLEAVRLLSAAGKPAERALAKLNESSSIIEEYRRKQNSPFRRWLARILNRKPEIRTYDVEIIDPATAVAKSMTVDFDNLHRKGVQTARLIASYGNKNTAILSKLDSMDEEGLKAMVEHNMIEVQAMVRLFPALHSYFQEEMDANHRGKLRGVKLEVNAIRNAMLKANQRRHEYMSRKEEAEHLKQLGIE